MLSRYRYIVVAISRGSYRDNVHCRDNEFLLNPLIQAHLALDPHPLARTMDNINGLKPPRTQGILPHTA